MGLSAWKVIVVLLVVAILFAPRLPALFDLVRRGIGRLDPETAAQMDREDAERARLAPRKVPWAERVATSFMRLVEAVRTRLRFGRRA